MVRRIAVLLAGLLLLIPTSGFANGFLGTDEAEFAGVADEAGPAIYAPIDIPARETGRELHEQ
jgi:hypothetical protein